ncbi:MAG: hypothetical protein D6744_01060, partial [Planctomycetota bacterium]
ARYDQQPIEAAAMIAACDAAYRATADRMWLRHAETCFRWFLGDNDAGQPVYVDATGGCCDGVQEDGLNRNRGAESTLAWLYSLAYMYDLQAEGLLGWSPETYDSESDDSTSSRESSTQPTKASAAP